MGRALEILGVSTPQEREASVARAAASLRRGEVVAIPTETVYGLAANALDEAAVARIYGAKGRPPSNPLIVHVASIAMAKTCTLHWPETAGRLAEAFWPGPLTVVLQKSDSIPSIVTAGGPTVALRWPAHPLAAAVIARADRPLAAPSANPSNQLSPTTAQHVAEAMEGRIGWVLDGGPCALGIESTVVDLTVVPARVLRPGSIGIRELRGVLGHEAVSELTTRQGRPAGQQGEPLRSPGNLTRHYAPRARLMVLPWEHVAGIVGALRGAGLTPKSVHVIGRGPLAEALSGVAGYLAIPADAAGFARELYSALHEMDRRQAETVVVQAPPSLPEWSAVADRLTRAAADQW